MTKNQHDLFLARAFAGFSVLASFVFVFYGVSIINSPDPAYWLRIFAYFTLGYGLVNIYLLSLAWRSRPAWAEWASRLFAICYFGVVSARAYHEGISAGSDFVLLLVVACVLVINWWAVKRAIGR